MMYVGEKCKDPLMGLQLLNELALDVNSAWMENRVLCNCLSIVEWTFENCAPLLLHFLQTSFSSMHSIYCREYVFVEATLQLLILPFVQTNPHMRKRVSSYYHAHKYRCQSYKTS